MSYSNGLTITYTFPSIDFGAGNSASAIKAPYGYSKGRIDDIGVAVTETFTQTTTPAYVRIGTASDADAYAQLNMAAAANTDYYNTQNDTDAIINADVDDTQLEVAFVAPTGGTPAGIGTVNITVTWFG